MLTYTAYVQITGEYEVFSGDEWNSTKLCTESYQIHNVKLFNNDNELLSEAKYNDIVELRDVLSRGPVDGYLMDAYNGEIF
jgi:transketolase N-terminal domain/subunit